MKKIQIAACLSALLFSAASFAACGRPNDSLRNPQEPPTSEVRPESPTMPEPSENEPQEPPVPEVRPESPTMPEPSENEPQAPTVPETPVTPPAASEPAEGGNEPSGTEPEPEAPPVSAVTPQKPAQAEYILVRTDGLNIRTGAGTSYASLGNLERGTMLKLVKQSGGWYETKYKNRTAYVSADARYTSVSRLAIGEEKTERVIDEGLKLLGTPYVYGAVRYHDGKGNRLKGFTVNAFDCSSLMQYIFYRGAGVLLDVTTRTQVSQGKAVSKANLKRGDLMFFTNASRKNNTGIERIGHVALYLGDNYILHTASDFAKVEQISALRWSYFITARRVL